MTDWQVLNEHCPTGALIYRRCQGIVVKSNGECTALYYHIQECDECEARRKQAQTK